jgi:hypothetical protein
VLVDTEERLLLVGDNPFHSISHLSQERARSRTEDPSNPKYAACLILTAIENGANGFTFSVSETTLAILKELNMHNALDSLQLYPVVPYAFEYVRFANQSGIPGLARKFGAELVRSKSLRSIGYGLKSALTTDLSSILKTYLSYEICRVRSVSSKARLESIILHQLITDMALALDLDWLFKEYIDFLIRRSITPGFNTGNFPVLVNKFREWQIDLGNIAIETPFNKAGFQMTPSIEECEKALIAIPKPIVIAISVFAAGYVDLSSAGKYIMALPNIKGVALGVSKEKHAKESFQFFKQSLKRV